MSDDSPLKSDNVRDFPHDRRSDADLVHAVAEGDERSLAVLWRRHAMSVKRTLRGCLGSEAHLDDLLQEVFLSFVRNAKRIQDPDRVRSYLTGAAIQLARRKHREQARRRRWQGLFAAEAQSRVSGNVVYERAALRSLQEILDELPTRSRESFVLRFVEGFSTAEVAEARGVSLATAKRDVAKAQERVLLRARRDEELSRYLIDDLIPGDASDASDGGRGHEQ
jgi:RNA polymerase sigma-70 factor (ECF subfamily)